MPSNNTHKFIEYFKIVSKWHVSNAGLTFAVVLCDVGITFQQYRLLLASGLQRMPNSSEPSQTARGLCAN